MMKRQIKFRAWIRGGTWNDDETERKFVMIDGDDLAFEEHKPLCDLLRDVNDEAYYMQFTGLTDKNGKEIYEGDIVRILYTDWPSQPAEKNGRYSMSLEQYKKSISKIRVVKYFAPEYYACNPETDSCGSLIPGRHGEIEVIGNIYQNPELTKA